MIIIENGIFVYEEVCTYYRDGFFHKETRRYLPVPTKFRDFLNKKAIKFWKKYKINRIPFTIGRDLDKHIDALAILHPKFDKFSERVGESIVLGRIKRYIGGINGDIQWTRKKRELDINYKEIIIKKWKIGWNEEGEPIDIYYDAPKYYDRTKTWKPYDKLPEYISVME